MTHSEKLDRFEVADRLHSAAIHLLRHARKQAVFDYTYDALRGMGRAEIPSTGLKRPRINL